MRVWWSNETKINCLGSDGGHWAWKEVGEGLSDKVVEGTLKFGGGNVMDDVGLYGVEWGWIYNQD